MADIAVSVLTRLKNKAKESGRSYQLCLQLFCQEEFLRRLEKSKYAENLVLKGGLFLYSLTNFDSRVTVDVDFMLRQMPNTPERLKGILEEIIAIQTGNDFVTFEITDVAPIAVAKKYAGIGASIELLVLKILVHRLALTLALEMLLCRSRKKEQFLLNLTILSHPQLILIPSKRLLLRKLMQYLV